MAAKLASALTDLYTRVGSLLGLNMFYPNKLCNSHIDQVHFGEIYEHAYIPPDMK